jgi:hypothetical protein
MQYVLLIYQGTAWEGISSLSDDETRAIGVPRGGRRREGQVGGRRADFLTDDGELQLITTLTSFATALDVTLAELRLEAFLPGDKATAEILKRRADAVRSAAGSQ